MCTGYMAGMRDAVAVFVGWQINENSRDLARAYAMQGSMPTTLLHTSLSIAAEAVADK